MPRIRAVTVHCRNLAPLSSLLPTGNVKMVTDLAFTPMESRRSGQLAAPKKFHGCYFCDLLRSCCASGGQLLFELMELDDPLVIQGNPPTCEIVAKRERDQKQ